MVSLLSAVFLLRCLFFEWVRGMQMLGAVCLKYLNPVLQCFAGFEGQITHTHTHAHAHTHMMEEWQMRITDISASNTKTWFFNLTTNSFFLFHCFVSPDQHFKGLIWVEGICNILLWGSESHQECIWLHRKLIFFWLPNDEPSLCNEHVPGESILYILRERRWDRLDSWTWFVCIFSISPFMDTLWTLYSHVQS